MLTGTLLRIPPYSKRTTYSNINYMPHHLQDFLIVLNSFVFYIKL